MIIVSMMIIEVWSERFSRRWGLRWTFLSIIVERRWESRRRSTDWRYWISISDDAWAVFATRLGVFMGGFVFRESEEIESVESSYMRSRHERVRVSR